MDSLKEKFEALETLPYDKLPDLDIYMDQLTSFLDDKLSGFKQNEDDKILTKTMINNYTKLKLMPPSEKKKYNKEHLIYAILIYHYKTALSMEDIKKLFEKLDTDIKKIYDIFTEIQKNEIENFTNNIEEKFKLFEEINRDEAITYLINYLLIDIELKKLAIEALLA